MHDMFADYTSKDPSSSMYRIVMIQLHYSSTKAAKVGDETFLSGNTTMCIQQHTHIHKTIVKVFVQRDFYCNRRAAMVAGTAHCHVFEFRW